MYTFPNSYGTSMDATIERESHARKRPSESTLKRHDAILRIRTVKGTPMGGYTLLCGRAGTVWCYYSKHYHIASTRSSEISEKVPRIISISIFLALINRIRTSPAQEPCHQNGECDACNRNY